MALTLAQLITRVEDNAGRTDKTDAQIVQWLNDALKAVARKHIWKDLVVEYEFTLVVSQFREAFPSDMKECLGIRIIDGTSSR